MKIEVAHNAVNLPVCAMVRVTNKKAAEAWTRKFMDAKRPRGLKIRHIPEDDTEQIAYSGRTMESLRTFIGALKCAGFVEKVYWGRRGTIRWQ